jgi:hypothetical protein
MRVRRARHNESESRVVNIGMICISFGLNLVCFESYLL